jgi:hypothetical protein
MVDSSGTTGDFEPPHSNGAVHQNPPKRTHAPWEFVILILFVLLFGILIILGWTLVGAHSPERLDHASARDIGAACSNAQLRLKALPNPNPVQGADRVNRIRAENAILTTMIEQIDAVRVPAKTPAAGVRGWTSDWTKVVAAREKYAADLESIKNEPNKRVQFVLPAVTGVKPITGKMDDYIRESHPFLDACFTAGLELETVEGLRTYPKVTQ